MKSKKIFYSLILSLILSVFFSISASAISVNYVTGYWSSPTYLDTTLWFSDSSQYIDACGYSKTQLYWNGTSDTSVLNSMKAGYSIWIYAGHGDPGTMIGPGSLSSIYGVRGTYNIASLPASSTSGIYWFMGCNEANTSNDYGNLSDQVIAKAKVGTECYAVDRSYYQATGQLWSRYTFQQISKNKTNLDSEIWSALNNAAKSTNDETSSSDIVCKFY